MGSKASVLLQDQEIEEIQRETGFSHNQIVRLYSRFTSLDKSKNGYLSREDFLRIPELAINPLGDRIVHAFFMDGSDDGVNFKQFMRTLARFRPIKDKNDKKNLLNSREEKLRFAFRMYDLDGNNFISRDELLAVLHMMVGANISEDQLGNIADRTIAEVDASGDDVISFDEFLKLGSIADRTIAEADLTGDNVISFEEFDKIMERVDVEQKMSIRFLN